MAATRWWLVAAAVALAACGSGDGDGDGDGDGGDERPAGTASTTSVASTTTTAPPTERTYEVGQEAMTLVDPSPLRGERRAFDDLHALVGSSGIAELRSRDV